MTRGQAIRRLVKIGLKVKQKMTGLAPNHRERQFMQYLRGSGWVQAEAFPSSPRVANLLTRGWIEQRAGSPGFAFGLLKMVLPRRLRRASTRRDRAKAKGNQPVETFIVTMAGSDHYRMERRRDKAIGEFNTRDRRPPGSSSKH
jgi:hypothetical protein